MHTTWHNGGLLRRRLPLPLLAVTIALAGIQPAGAQDSGPLIDALVRKGVLTDKEGEEIRAELTQEYEKTSPAKIKLSNSIQELRLYGDLRLRYQYDNKDWQADPAEVGAPGFGSEKDRSPSGSQRSRWRFRLRLNADFKLTENIFGGVELQTAIASDSANETYQDGFRDYPIFISKAYIGWTPYEWLTFTAGKVPNPFYTTELVWDSDIFPTGITEQIAFHKLRRAEVVAPDGKGVAPMISDSPWELTLVAGQFIFDDNLEGGGRDPGEIDNDETTDSYLFQTQLIAAYSFRKDLKLTVAPGWLVHSGGSASGVENNNPFQDSDLVSGATRNLNLLLFPGDLSFTVAGIKTRLHWDFSYNIEGRERVEEIYRLGAPGAAGHSSGDDYAFLAGVLLGENRKKGDWSLFANYRRTGLGAVDPNLNDSDFADAELNTEGLKFGGAYNLTDFAVFAVTLQYAWQIRDIQGGEATGGQAVSDANAVQTIQADLSVKF